MPINISWKLSVQVASGPAYVAANALQVDALDRIEVTVPDSVTTTIDVQPGAAGKTRFLLIRSSKYDAAKLKYFVHNNTTTQRSLTEALFLVEAGGLDLLEDAAAPLDKLVVDNTTGGDVVLEILVGRDAI